MGLLILPYLLGAIAICINCLRHIIRWHKENVLKKALIFKGILISLVLFFVVGMSYYFQERVYAFSPVFRIPLLLIYIPGILGFALVDDSDKRMRNRSRPIVISVLVSAIILIVFNKYVFGILDYLNIETYY